jgi:hypothetical protein
MIGPRQAVATVASYHAGCLQHLICAGEPIAAKGPRSHDRRSLLPASADRGQDLARSIADTACRPGRAAEAPIAAGFALGRKRPGDLSDMRGAARAHQSRPRLAAVGNSSALDRSSATRSASSPSFFAVPAPPAVGGESAPSQTGASASAAPEGGQGARESCLAIPRERRKKQ